METLALQLVLKSARDLRFDGTVQPLLSRTTRIFSSGVNLRRVAVRTLCTKLRVSRVRASACSDLLTAVFSDTFCSPIRTLLQGTQTVLTLSYFRPGKCLIVADVQHALGATPGEY